MKTKRGGRFENINTSNVVAVLGPLASVLLPAISTLIIKKLMDKDPKNDKEAIEQLEDILEVVEDEIIKVADTKLTKESTSLLNRILGKGIIEI